MTAPYYAYIKVSEATAWKRWNETPADSRYVIGGELAIKGGDGRMTVMKFKKGAKKR